MPAITLNDLAAALIGAGATIYYCTSRGYWKACAIVCGQRIERNNPDPYAALAAAAATLVECEAAQHALDWANTPEARAAYRQAWAASEGQPVPARFAAAEAAAATVPAACRKCAGTGLDYAAADCCLSCGGSGLDDTARSDEADDYLSGYDDDDESGRDYEEELAGDFYAQAYE